MNYFINPQKLNAVFSVPSAAVDEHIKLSNEKQLKCLLVFLRNAANGCNEEYISDVLNLPLSEVSDALAFWKDAGLLISDNDSAVITDSKNGKSGKMQQLRPTREETIERGKSSEALQFIFREAQLKFGRPLKQSETALLVWLHDDLGFESSLILMLLQYAKSEANCNVRFIEKTACEWSDSGVTDIKTAEDLIAVATRQNICWKTVVSAFGMPYRMPSTKERTLASLWIEEWKMPRELLGKAYEECVDATSKFSIPYISKVLEKWHKAGVTNVDEIPEKETKKTTKDNSASYDIDLVNQLLNGD